ncbi:MAG: 2'-5' RNA ligase family protein [Pseudomonadota bacterium]
MLFVLAYPKFAPLDAKSIARFRSANEPERAKLVDPHVTLVFGMKNALLPDLAIACGGVARITSKFAISFTASEIVYDPHEGVHKLCLLVSEGRQEIVALHEDLQDGPQQDQRDTKIGFSPHMTVATNRKRSIIEELDTAAIRHFPIAGIIEKLHIVKLAEETLHPLETFELGR